ncbi:MAG: right-handed parallel beta-helix repeat-containing protein, partial [Verrucomicrobia bacterium]|nr:right-handed parallel beta-helix repeat-containing protein [Verrucomicrobiota bacterium]
NLPVTLNTSGSYYLTTNLTGASGEQGILINQHNITVDLMGFELRGVPGSASGVFVSGSLSNLCVRNGVISGWNSRGVSGSSARNSQWLDLRVSGNSFGGLEAGANSLVRGCSVAANGGTGILVGNLSLVESCIVQGQLGDGINAGDAVRVATCNVYGCGQNGIVTGRGGVVVSSITVSNGANGVLAGDESAVADCAARQNLSVGIAVGQDSQVRNSLALTNGSTGLELGDGSSARGCTVRQNLGTGIRGNFNPAQRCEVNYCVVSQNSARGIDVESSRVTGCLVVSNATDGISCRRSTILENQCVGHTTTFAAGIMSLGQSVIQKNVCEQNTYGIYTFLNSLGNHLEGNTVIENTIGIYITGGVLNQSRNNLVIRNAARGNGTDYDIYSDNTVGPIVTKASIATNSNPHANYQF